jgi:hypothetical protein
VTNAMGPSRQDMLGVYLNDHLAGATAGSERTLADTDPRLDADCKEPPGG